MVLIGSGRLVYLINTRAEIYLIREEKARELGLSYMADRHLKLIDVNGDETIIMGVCENIKISIGLITVIQIFIVIENASQNLVFDIPYIYTTQIKIQAHPDGYFNILIYCPDTNREVHFLIIAKGSKVKYLSYLYPRMVSVSRKLKN